MPSLRQRLESLRDEALICFAQPEDRGRAASARRELAPVMAEVSSVILGSPLLGPACLSSHQRNTRRMTSSLSLKRYECWDQSITYDQDTPIGRREAGEEEYSASVEEANEIFLAAFRDTIELLDLAEPVKADTGTTQPQTAGLGASKGRRRGPAPDTETAVRVADIVNRERLQRPWRAALEDICEALDSEQVKRPHTWKKRGHRTWCECLDLESHLVKEAVRHHLKLAQAARETIP